MADISVNDGKLITTEAAKWKGTPYKLIGSGSQKGAGGDCSGTTQKIFEAAKCSYKYQMASSFATYASGCGLFRELGPKDTKQDGDILSWSNHMAIYCSFADDVTNATTSRLTKGHSWTQHNNMWTASHPDGPDYAPAELRYWRTDTPKVFRYQK